MSDEGVGITVVLSIMGFALFMLVRDPEHLSDGWVLFYLTLLFSPLFLGFIGLVLANDSIDKKEKMNGGNHKQTTDYIMERLHKSHDDFLNNRKSTTNTQNIQNNHYESLYKRYKS